MGPFDKPSPRIGIKRAATIGVSKYDNDLADLVSALSDLLEEGYTTLSLGMSLVPPGNVDQREHDTFWFELKGGNR